MTEQVIDAGVNPGDPAPAADQGAVTPETVAKPELAADPNAGKAAEPDAGTSLTGAADERADPLAYWPDDWRDRFAGDDDKLRSRLGRFSSPDSIFKSFLAAEKKIAGGLAKPPLPENATADELAAWRKDNGIPETAEGYVFKAPEGVELTDEDKSEIAYFQSAFHEMNLPPDSAGKLFDAYFQRRVELEQDLREAARETTVTQRAELRAEYGKEYGRNISLAKNWLDGVMGAEKREALVDVTLADGTKLGDHPEFVRMTVQAGLANAGDDVLAEAEFGSSGVSLDEQYREALDLKFTDPAKYHSKEHQDKLLKLAAGQKTTA